MTAVDKLAATPPRPVLTRLQQVERYAGRVLLVIALVLATAAIAQATRAINCINDNLGERGVKSQQYDGALGDILIGLRDESRGVLSKEALSARVNSDLVVLAEVAAYRKSHPLGQC